MPLPIHPAAPVGLADALQAHTRALHRQAERSGIMHALLRGEADRGAYVLFLRNLLPAYLELERSLERLGAAAPLRGLARRAVYRAPHLEADLGVLGGSDWRALPVLVAAQRYADRIGAAAQRGPLGLVAHAYVRYLGDLNGGRVLRAALAQSLRLPAQALSFYAFAEVADLDRFRDEYRAAIDGLRLSAAQRQRVLDEAVEAFRLNIALSEAIGGAQAAARSG
jgi:heme oxygenase